jgi:DNA-binding NarL/FixJ family response regulator
VPASISGCRLPDATIRLVIADDHAVVLKGLESLLTLEPDLAVLATCADGKATLDAVRQHHPDVLLLDLMMPGLDGLGVLRALKTERKPPRVVLLTANIEDQEVLDAMELGVAGVFLKEMPPHLLVQCIRKVHAGEQWIETQSVTRAVGRLLQRQSSEREMARILTPRELEIVRMVAQGQRTSAIASTLNVSQGTVKTHLHNIYDKLNLDGRVALTVFAREKGLV